jgi:4a-hydroxytetrahydrobiopterin dehydratase
VPVPAAPRPRPLDDEEIDRQLADLPGVRRDTATSLVLRVRAGSFADAVRLVDLVAQDAEQMDHHPEIHLRLRVVTFTFTSNWERAVTQYDVELAHRVLEAVREVGAEVLTDR